MRHFRAYVMAAVMVLAAGALAVSCSSTEPVAAGTDGLAAYDKTIPEGSHDAYYMTHWDLDSLTLASDIVFTGRVTGYVEAALTIHSAASGRTDVYDGVVFTVDDLIAGELPAGMKQVTIPTFALILDEHGDPLVRISKSPIEIVRDGIEQRNLPDGPLYLVYALQPEPENIFYKPDFYHFNTPGAVVRIMDDGSLGTGAEPPLYGAIASDGKWAMIDHGLTLDDVRVAAGVPTNDADPPTEVELPTEEPVGGPLDDDSAPETPSPETESPTTTSRVIEPPTTTEPPVTAPPTTTNPPNTEPPVTEPPVTEPPTTNPPVTEPPVTDPPNTEPPVTEPPVTEPPVTDPPTTTNPPNTEPPVTEPPVIEPPVTEPTTEG